MKWPLRRWSGTRAGAALAATIIAVLPAAAACEAPGSAGASAEATSGLASGSWGTATPVPGLARLNAGGNAWVSALSCASAGNCAAGGSYKDGHGHFQAFVASERNGHWGTAIEVPGLARLNAGGNATMSSVSCGSGRNCAASGSYKDGHGHFQAFVASERNGHWGTAIEVPGLARLNAGGNATMSSVSCGSGGNCAARGFYVDGHHHTRLFMTSERNGRWSAAIAVPGTVGRVRAGVYSMWCDRAGNCVAGGSYNNGQRYRAFVAAERNGRWDTAVNVLRTAGLNAGGNAWVNALSCASAGNCTAGGSYADRQGHFHVFVASERNGRWDTAIEVPGIASLNVRHLPQVSSVSCGSAGNCVAGGAYVDSTGNRHAFVTSERNGRWNTAIEVPGTRARSWVTSVSCGSAGNCTADGGYVDSSGQDQPFVTSERNGRWDTAIQVPGIASLDAGRSNEPGSAEIGPLSCTGAGYCVAGDFYTDYFGQIQAFIVSRR